jgi:hypothetical protein
MAAGFFTGTTVGIIAGIAAAGAVATVVAVKKSQSNSTPEPIVAGPPIITPK